MIKKPTKRYGFNFLRSYFDVLNELKDDADKLNFLTSIINKQFLDENPKDLNFITNLCYESQRHFIEKSVKGYKDRMKTDLLGKALPEGVHKGVPEALPNKSKSKSKSNKTKGFSFVKIPFKDFWEMYGKKEGFNYTEGYWNRLDPDTQKIIMDFLPKYIASKPNPRYRKKPENFLIDEAWKDELPEMDLSEIKDKTDPRFKLLTRDEKIKWIKLNIKF